jgi:hypothetical protein
VSFTYNKDLPLEYFYLCHINYRPVDGAKLLYTAKHENIVAHHEVPDGYHAADKTNAYLERLDKSWDLFLDKLGDIGDEEYLPDGFDVPLEQILHYFIYRHFISAEDENDAKERLAFAVLSVRIIGAMFRKCIEENNSSLETLVEISRMYSGEIEYSEENTESLLEYLSEYRYEIN